MSERKVLNKYYPPDFDPSKIPKLKGAKVNKQWSIRIMAPFNMRCNTCGEYIYKGKKFNSKKETVEDDDYLGLHIYRFYIKCPRCVAEIAFKTDPQNTDYSLEAGATRNFEASKTAEEMAKKEAAAIEEEEANNPMKVLENRTKQSMQEMEMIETLEELKEMNTRHARVDFNSMLEKHKVYEEQLARLQDEEDENLVKSIFGKDADKVVRRLDDDAEDNDTNAPLKKKVKTLNATDLLTDNPQPSKSCKTSKLAGLIKPKSSIAGLVKPKKSTAGFMKPQSTTDKPAIMNVNSNNSLSKANDAQDEKKTEILSKPNTGNTQDHSIANVTEKKNSVSSGGLGLLGNYSDSDSSENE